MNEGLQEYESSRGAALDCELWGCRKLRSSGVFWGMKKSSAARARDIRTLGRGEVSAKPVLLGITKVDSFTDPDSCHSWFG